MSKSNLDNLVEMAGSSGIDIAPTLLRVLTDLYVQRHNHSAEEERHYSSLALRLIDLVDLGTRATIASRLAAYSCAPLAVLERLVADEPDAANPILKYSQVWAQRGQAIAPALPDPDELEPLLTQESPRIEIAVADAHTTPRYPELNELFMSADAAGRRLILGNLHYSQIPPAKISGTPAIAERLQRYALGGQKRLLTDEIETVLAVAPQQAARIVGDPLGEPMVVAAKALAIPPDHLHRILLFIHPDIGQSFTRLFELAALYDTMPADVAAQMVTVWREADTVSRVTRRQPASHYSDGVMRRDTRAHESVQALPEPRAISA